MFIHLNRAIHSVHRVDFGLDVSDRFEIGFCAHIFLHNYRSFLESGQIGFGYNESVSNISTSKRLKEEAA